MNKLSFVRLSFALYSRHHYWIQTVSCYLHSIFNSISVFTSGTLSSVRVHDEQNKQFNQPNVEELNLNSLTKSLFKCIHHPLCKTQEEKQSDSSYRPKQITRKCWVDDDSDKEVGLKQDRKIISLIPFLFATLNVKSI